MDYTYRLGQVSPPLTMTAYLWFWAVLLLFGVWGAGAVDLITPVKKMHNKRDFILYGARFLCRLYVVCSILYMFLDRSLDEASICKVETLVQLLGETVLLAIAGMFDASFKKIASWLRKVDDRLAVV
jgi:hypothetical protein